MRRYKVAILGGGIAGLTAAYSLHDKYDITLFEKENRLGGNAHTHQTRTGELMDIAVACFPYADDLLRLFSELKVKTVRLPASCQMSIHNIATNEGIYLTPLSLKGLIAQRFALFKPSNVKVSLKTHFFMKRLMELLDQGELAGLSMEEAIKSLPDVPDRCVDYIMAPLCLLSSMYYKEIMDGPAEFFVAKMKAMGHFEPVNQLRGLRFPREFTKSYVDALSSYFSEKVVLNSQIKSVARDDGGVTLRMENGDELVFDKVVFACNADQALGLLERPTEEEKRLLGAWRYKDGLMTVHTDNSCFPHRDLCQSWTALQSQNNGTPHYSISICTWRACPGTSNESGFFSTQHLDHPIAKDSVDFEKYFRTPIYDPQSFRTIEELPSLNGKMNSYYCGSHFGFGLHNDAVKSALAVARMLKETAQG